MSDDGQEREVRARDEQEIAGEREPRVDRAPRQRLGVEARQGGILDAAAAVFAASPYAEVRVADVAARAGASPALIFRYFTSKAGLYAAVVERAVATLEERQTQADAALHPGVPARDRVRAALEVYVDHVAADSAAWANPLVGGEEPPEALQVRARARTAAVERLRAVLLPAPTWARHHFALQGYLGFVDHACLAWVHEGCPDDRRSGLVEACLGSLQGALGDWGR